MTCVPARQVRQGAGGGKRRSRQEKTHVSLERSALVDGEEEDDVLAFRKGFAEDRAVLDLGCPESLWSME
jgi:hypothetical protein